MANVATGLVLLLASVATFLLTLVVGATTFMVMIGGGILALITFGVIDYRKSKKTPPVEDL